jgi:hypothetical protein
MDEEVYKIDDEKTGGHINYLMRGVEMDEKGGVR